MSELEFPEFRPHPLLANGHAQTIVAAYAPGKLAPYQAARHGVSLADGDRLVLHDDQPATWRTGRPVALLLHGLAGCHRSPYLVRVAAKLNQRGVRTFRMDLRGCGAGFQLARKPFHAGRSDDAQAALEFVAAQTSGSPISLIGFSLSGNIVLKLAGELADRAPAFLRQVVAVAPPIDLLACARNLQRPGVRRLYDRSFVRSLSRMRRQRVNAGYADVDPLPKPQQLYEFDDRYTAPLGGFRDALDYYQRSSAAPLLPAIRVETVILTSEDDPLVPIAPFHDARLATKTRLYITSRGGHLGYLGVAGVDHDRRWMDWRIVHWVTMTEASHEASPQGEIGRINVC